VTDQINVLIVDDHPIVRSGLRSLLTAESDIEVVGEATDGKEGLEQTETLRPHVILMDISMPNLDGLEATRQIKSRFPDVQILVLSMHRSDEYFFEMLRAGASGYILKSARTSDLLEAIRVVSRGEVFLYPAMAQKLVRGYLKLADWENDTQTILSPREKEILFLMAEGYSYKNIAEKLVISPSTVYSHRSNLMSKLGLNNRHELIEYARKRQFTQS
jgi:two-component system, NarL family, response regulator NreC